MMNLEPLRVQLYWFPILVSIVMYSPEYVKICFRINNIQINVKENNAFNSMVDVYMTMELNQRKCYLELLVTKVRKYYKN